MKRFAASLLLIAFSICVQPARAERLEPEAARWAAQESVGDVLDALANGDFRKLASFVGQEGLIVSPYVMIDDGDVRLSRSEVERCSTDSRTRHWGERDGSGDAIDATCSRYFEEFVWNADYWKADEVLYNDPRQRGNEVNNNHAFAPDGVVVELHIRGEGNEAAMNWKSLRLIFRDSDRGLSLIAITRDVWTV